MASLIASDGLHHQVVADLDQREQRLHGLVEFHGCTDKTEHQIRSREARIEALEAALRARDRQLDALIAQSLERSGIALMGPAIGAAADADALETALPRRSTRRSVPST